MVNLKSNWTINNQKKLDYRRRIGLRLGPDSDARGEDEEDSIGVEDRDLERECDRNQDKEGADMLRSRFFFLERGLDQDAGGMEAEGFIIGGGEGSGGGVSLTNSGRVSMAVGSCLTDSAGTASRMNSGSERRASGSFIR